ncbi:MAG: RNA 2',3'-cyclic phosphodiesterase [Desulfobacterales bacterium]
MDSIRAFIAFKLPDRIPGFIREIQKKLKQRGIKLKWVLPENVHLTLKFLGDIPCDRIDSIETAIKVSAEGMRPISLLAGSIGVFPNASRPRVVWIGIDGEIGILAGFQKKLDENLAHLGFQAETRTYKGHLTIGRVRKAPDPENLKTAIRDFFDYKTEPFHVDEVILFQSDLKPEGAVYTCLKNIRFSDDR